jgi:hypothetical protein
MRGQRAKSFCGVQSDGYRSKMPISASVVNGIGNILSKPENPAEKQAISNDSLAAGVAIWNIAIMPINH